MRNMRAVGKRARMLRPILREKPAARDEVPRLIPPEHRELSRLEHYLDLADIALGLKRADH